MALLDVSDVLLDPDFADSLVCERLAQNVGDDGIAVNTAKVHRFAGVVTNDSGDKLSRISSGERVEGNIVVHSVFRLQDGSSGMTADVVTWRGRRFTVVSVNDWSHFGRGFTAAKCDLIPLSG